MSNRWFCHRTGGMRRICGGRASGWSSITPPDRKKREGWATRSFVVGEKWFGGQRLREQGFGYVISSDLPDSVEEEDIFAPACL